MRINLYITAKIKARMDKRPDVNWSAEFQKLVMKITERDWLLVSTREKQREVEKAPAGNPEAPG